MFSNKITCVKTITFKAYLQNNLQLKCSFQVIQLLMHFAQNESPQGNIRGQHSLPEKGFIHPSQLRKNANGYSCCYTLVFLPESILQQQSLNLYQIQFSQTMPQLTSKAPYKSRFGTKLIKSKQNEQSILNNSLQKNQGIEQCVYNRNHEQISKSYKPNNFKPTLPKIILSDDPKQQQQRYLQHINYIEQQLYQTENQNQKFRINLQLITNEKQLLQITYKQTITKLNDSLKQLTIKDSIINELNQQILQLHNQIQDNNKKQNLIAIQLQKKQSQFYNNCIPYKKINLLENQQFSSKKNSREHSKSNRKRSKSHKKSENEHQKTEIHMKSNSARQQTAQIYTKQLEYKTTQTIDTEIFAIADIKQAEVKQLRKKIIQMGNALNASEQKISALTTNFIASKAQFNASQKELSLSQSNLAKIAAQLAQLKDDMSICQTENFNLQNKIFVSEREAQTLKAELTIEKAELQNTKEKQKQTNIEIQLLKSNNIKLSKQVQSLQSKVMTGKTSLQDTKWQLNQQIQFLKQRNNKLISTIAQRDAQIQKLKGKDIKTEQKIECTKQAMQKIYKDYQELKEKKQQEINSLKKIINLKEKQLIKQIQQLEEQLEQYKQYKLNQVQREQQYQKQIEELMANMQQLQLSMQEIVKQKNTQTSICQQLTEKQQTKNQSGHLKQNDIHGASSENQICSIRNCSPNLMNRETQTETELALQTNQMNKQSTDHDIKQLQEQIDCLREGFKELKRIRETCIDASTQIEGDINTFQIIKKSNMIIQTQKDQLIESYKEQFEAALLQKMEEYNRLQDQVNEQQQKNQQLRELQHDLQQQNSKLRDMIFEVKQQKSEMQEQMQMALQKSKQQMNRIEQYARNLQKMCQTNASYQFV